MSDIFSDLIQNVNQTALNVGSFLGIVSQTDANIRAAGANESGIPDGGYERGVTSADLDNRFNNITSNTSNPENKIASTKGKTVGFPNLQYPSETAPYYMKFDFANYTRINHLNPSIFQPLQTIILPLPDGSGLNDATSANWGTADLGMTGAAINNIDGLNSMINSFTKGAESSPGGMGDRFVAGASAIVQDRATQDLAAYVIDQIGRNAATEFTNAVIIGEQGAGAAINPGMSAYFQGINFRSFAFNWTFAPKTEGESETIRNIINTFKARSLPTFSGSTSLLFNYPAVVKPSFYLNDLDPKGLGITAFKQCVIKDVTVRFSPQGEAPSFYSKTAAPVFIALSISLQEIEYMLAEDYDPNAKSFGVNKDTAGARLLGGIVKVGTEAFNIGQSTADAVAAVTSGKPIPPIK
jgi:hypothetical protein